VAVTGAWTRVAALAVTVAGSWTRRPGGGAPPTRINVPGTACFEPGARRRKHRHDLDARCRVPPRALRYSCDLYGPTGQEVANRPTRTLIEVLHFPILTVWTELMTSARLRPRCGLPERTLRYWERSALVQKPGARAPQAGATLPTVPETSHPRNPGHPARRRAEHRRHARLPVAVPSGRRGRRRARELF